MFNSAGLWCKPRVPTRASSARTTVCARVQADREDMLFGEYSKGCTRFRKVSQECVDQVATSSRFPSGWKSGALDNYRNSLRSASWCRQVPVIPKRGIHTIPFQEKIMEMYLFSIPVCFYVVNSLFLGIMEGWGKSWKSAFSQAYQGKGVDLTLVLSLKRNHRWTNKWELVCDCSFSHVFGFLQRNKHRYVRSEWARSPYM